MRPRIGELLLAGGLVTPVQLEHALKVQRMYGGKLGTNLIELGFVEEGRLADFLARQFSMTAARPEDFQAISEDVLGLVGRKTAEKHRLIPLRLEKKLVVAISDPTDLDAIDDVAHRSGKAVQTVIAPEVWIIAALERCYGVPRETRFIRMDDALLSADDESSLTGIADEINGPIQEERIRRGIDFVDYVSRLMAAADKEAIFDALVATLGAHFPCLAVFVLRGETLTGWMVRGFPVRVAAFGKVTIPFEEDTLLSRAVRTKAAVYAELPGDAAHARVREALGIHPGTNVEVHPVRFRNRGVAVVLCLRGGREGGDPLSEAEIRIACEKAGFALELLFARTKIAEIPTVE